MIGVDDIAYDVKAASVLDSNRIFLIFISNN